MNRFAPLLLLGALACGDSSPSTPLDGSVRVDIEETRPGAPPIGPATECVVRTWSEPARAQDHRAVCSAIDYASLPPASGPHFSVWADFATYGDEVPWGYLVHSLEHGAIFLGYDCPEGCPEVLDAFAAVIEAHGDDPLCATHPSADARFIVAPVSGLDAPVVALAWEYAYTATCVDDASLSAFVEDHYGLAPEDLCNPGAAVTEGDWCP
ncbi:MAG: hypothetical protein CMN30_13265 [Sandaracinus sp.]|nr:hypothetical protein [Sandaracinus sp.]